jgi:NADH-quinone oxidoreductase subunit C
LTVDWNRQNWAGDDVEKHPAVLGIKSTFPGSVLDVTVSRGEVSVIVKPERCVDVLGYLRDSDTLSYNFLSDLTAVHWPGRSETVFDVVYQLYSIANRMRLRVKAPLAEGQSIPTATSVWSGADWLEREVFDMFGIVFDGHPDQRRIINPDGFDGHPLRKDFPLAGKVKW